MPDLLISIVSHQQADLAVRVLADLDRISPSLEVEVILTLNVDEPTPTHFDRRRWPVRMIRNSSPRGFGANHNAAFRTSSSRRFCVLNPDIRLTADPFPGLLQLLENRDNAVAAPAVVNERGIIEDSARKVPTPASIVLKAMSGSGRVDYEYGHQLIYPDWVGGMFMLCDSRAFEEIGGFDERYFLYYEDVDFCSRLRLAGRRIVVDPCVRVIHDARRTSHKDPRYLGWHMHSMLRFFTSRTYRRIRQIK